MRIRSNHRFFLGLLFIVSLFLVIFFLEYRRTAPELIPNVEKLEPTTSFLVFGDSGTGGSQQKELAGVMLDFPFDFILHTGDVAYPDGSKQQLQDNFISIYKDHIARGPVYPSPGNHDYLTDNLAPYLSLFDLPKQALREKDYERYYSFNIRNIHIVALDTNTPLDEISDKQLDDMSDWLEDDLKKSENYTWKIIFFHHPPYSSGEMHGGDLRVRKILVPLFEKYHVDLVFSGHEHNYERTCRISDNACSSKGIMYIVTGGGGAAIYDFGEQDFFTASRSAQYHFVSTVISGCQLKAEVVGLERKVIDTFSLDKCRPS